MGAPAPLRFDSVDAFLAWDATQTERRELVSCVLREPEDKVSAPSGVEDRHVTVALNIAMTLRQHLQGTPCRTYMSDMNLRVQPAGSVFYPDVMVTCSAADAASKLAKQEPTLLVEVLSPSTAAYDRGEKFAHYRRVVSLRKYLLVDLDSCRSDVCRKGADGLWVLHPHDPGQDVLLASVELSLPAEQLFAEVDE